MTLPAISEDELQAFVDGELPRGRSTAVLAHLGRHPEEIERLARYALQKDELRRGIAATNLPGDDPATLQLQQALAGRLRRRDYGAWLRRAAAVALLLATGWSGHGLYLAYLDHRLPSLVVEAAQAHEVFGDDSQRPVELTAASQAEMRAWFSRHLGEEVEIPSLHAIACSAAASRTVSYLSATNGTTAALTCPLSEKAASSESSISGIAGASTPSLDAIRFVRVRNSMSDRNFSRVAGIGS